MELNVIKRVIAIAAVALTTSAAKAQGYAEPVYTNPNGSELTAKAKNDLRPNDVSMPMLAGVFGSANSSFTSSAYSNA